MFGWGKDRKKRKKRDGAAEGVDSASDAADVGGEGIEAVADGCGCDISLVALIGIAGLSAFLMR